MEPFKTSFSPIVTLMRIAFVLIFISFCLSVLGDKYILYVIGIAGAFFVAVFRGFWTTTKNYSIHDKYIEVYNFLSFTTLCVEKPEIKGFSTSMQVYRIWDFDQIIYLNNGEKLILTQFSYFNFSKIEQALLARNYTYLGHEQFNNEMGQGRKYKFDR